MLGFGAIGETAIGEIAQRAPSLADPDPKTGALRPPCFPFASHSQNGKQNMQETPANSGFCQTTT